MTSLPTMARGYRPVFRKLSLLVATAAKPAQTAQDASYPDPVGAPPNRRLPAIWMHRTGPETCRRRTLTNRTGRRWRSGQSAVDGRRLADTSGSAIGAYRGLWLSSADPRLLRVTFPCMTIARAIG